MHGAPRAGVIFVGGRVGDGVPGSLCMGWLGGGVGREGGGGRCCRVRSGAFQSLGDDALATRLDRSGADLPAVGEIARIVHAAFVVAEVLKLDAVRLQALGGPTSSLA